MYEYSTSFYRHRSLGLSTLGVAQATRACLGVGNGFAVC